MVAESGDDDAETASTLQPPAKATTAANPSSDEAIVKKTDPITALQESIDSLSLAMFEALRGVRDAVAPESGNLGMASQQGAPPQQQEPQMPAAAAAAATDSEQQPPAENVDELWRLYRCGDSTVTSMIQKLYPPSSSMMITRREDFVRIYTKMEMERKDSALVGTFATMVLDKFDEIRFRVNQIPGLHRTRCQQMEYIQELMDQNAQLQQQLDQAYQQARQRQAKIYQLVDDQTNRALGMEQVVDVTAEAATTTTTTDALAV